MNLKSVDLVLIQDHRMKKKQQTVQEANKTIQLRQKLRNKLKQTQNDETIVKKIKKKFEPITQRLDKVEKAVRQIDEDLSKKLELIPINKKFKPRHLTFTKL